MLNKVIEKRTNKIIKFLGLQSTKHHLKFEKNQADNLGYIGFRRRFFPVFYWCLVLYSENRQFGGVYWGEIILEIAIFP